MDTPTKRSGSEEHGAYIPALSFRWLTRFYDPLIRLTLREEEIKRGLIEAATIKPGHAVLDVGCGTGTLAIMIKLACPQAQVVGLDGDTEILAIAREKASTAGADIDLREGFAYELPFADASFDRVVSSLVFHHLSTNDKSRALSEVYRILRPNGTFLIADFGKPQNPLMGVASLTIRALDGAETMRVNLEGRLPAFIRDAGLVDVAEVARTMTLFGTLALYRGTRPAAAHLKV